MSNLWRSVQTNSFLTLRPVSSERQLEMLERETISLFESISAAEISGQWVASPVQEKYRLIHEAILRTPGMLRRFRRTFLAGGRLNFPDSPRPKENFLQWGSRLPSRIQYLEGGLHLLKMVLQLRRCMRFNLSDLDDNLIGQPSTYMVPRSITDLGRFVAGCIFGLNDSQHHLVYHLTEARIREFYYRSQICAAFGTNCGPILEIGGGYAGLAAELLQHVFTPTYLFVELPYALALAHFYLRACFNCSIQILYRPEDKLDPSVRIVLVAPWKLADLKVEVDLVINTMSFQHMDRENLEFYFSHIDRLNAKRMYLVNRNTKRDPSDVIIDNYPVPERLHIVSDSKWLFGDHRERIYKTCV